MSRFVHPGEAMAEFRRSRGLLSEAEMDGLAGRLNRSGLLTGPPPPRPRPPRLCALCSGYDDVLSRRIDDVEVDLCAACRDPERPQPMGPTRSWWLWPIYLLAGRW